MWEGRLNGREGDMHGNVRHGGEYVWQGRGHAWWVCMAGVEACMAGGVHGGEAAIEAGGTHPTGMHSCLSS